MKTATWTLRVVASFVFFMCSAKTHPHNLLGYPHNQNGIFRNMMYELPTPNFGDLGDFLEDAEAVNLLYSSSVSHNDEQEIETFTTTTSMGFSSLDTLPSIFEPTPIDPKRAMVVDTFHSANDTWYTTDETKFFDDVIRGLRTLIETSSSSKKVPAAYQSGPLLLSEARNKAPKGGLDPYSIFHPFSSSKRAIIMSSRRTRSEVESTTTYSSSGDATLRRSHIENWGMRFSELVEYEKEYGNCLVPLNWPCNPALAHWVKRQRYQYRIKNEGKHSSMTPERQQALQELGFTWDSHSVAWLERWQELAEFKEWYGHPNVPKKYPENSQLKQRVR
jgi:hypothetical protein